MKSNFEVWPVIHVRDTVQVCENAAIARQAGCTGVLLVAMDGCNENSDHAAARLIRNPLHPDFKVGVNYLGKRPTAALRHAMAHGYDALWMDEQLFSAGGCSLEGQSFLRVWQRAAAPPKVFAAVAFKGQPHDPRPGESAYALGECGIIPTTSGPGTGMMATIEKVAECRPIGSPWPLALASGVTPENMHQYIPFVTHILVNTGISKDFHTFDPERLAALMDAVEAHGGGK